MQHQCEEGKKKKKTQAAWANNESCCSDKSKRHIMKEVLNVELIDQTSLAWQTSPLLHRLRALTYQPHFGITAVTWKLIQIVITAISY